MLGKTIATQLAACAKVWDGQADQDWLTGHQKSENEQKPGNVSTQAPVSRYQASLSAGVRELLRYLLRRALPTMILPRGYYREFSRDLSVNSPRELHKALQLEVEANRRHGFQLLSVTSPVSNGRASVLFFEFPETIAQQNVGRLILPESLLLGALMRAHSQTAARIQADQEAFLAVIPAGDADAGIVRTVSERHFHFGLGNFAESLGVAVNREPDAKDTDAAAQHEFQYKWDEAAKLSALRNLPFSQLLALWRQRATNPLPWDQIRRFASLTGAMAAAYLICLSAWLAWQNSALDTRLAELRPEIGRLLQAEDELRDRSKSVAVVQQILEDSTQPTHVLALVNELLEIAELELQQVQVTRQRIQVAGEAPSALTVLEMLVKHRAVDDAAFVQPAIPRKNGKEYFAIEFNLDAVNLSVEEVTDESDAS